MRGIPDDGLELTACHAGVPVARTAAWTLALALLTSLLPHAPATAQPVQTKTMSDIHTVAIIAALGNQAKYQRVGLMVFGNESGPVDIESWGLDDAVVHEMTAVLQGHYAVRNADYDHAAFATADVSGGDWLGSEPTLYNLLVQRNDRALVDAYIVVVRGGVKDIVGGTNQPMIGLGMYRHPFGLSGHVVADYAIFDVFVVDSYTCKEITTSKLILGEDQFDNPIFPVRQTKESDFPENYADLTSMQIEDLRDTSLQLLESATRPTLTQLRFKVNPQTSTQQ
ncbi:MAG: hypothetical protein ACREHE_14245 [Rhizomicrobium sp.]